MRGGVFARAAPHPDPLPERGEGADCSLSGERGKSPYRYSHSQTALAGRLRSVADDAKPQAAGTMSGLHPRSWPRQHAR